MWMEILSGGSETIFLLSLSKSQTRLCDLAESCQPTALPTTGEMSAWVLGEGRSRPGSAVCVVSHKENFQEKQMQLWTTKPGFQYYFFHLLAMRTQTSNLTVCLLIYRKTIIHYLNITLHVKVLLSQIQKNIVVWRSYY